MALLAPCSWQAGKIHYECTMNGAIEVGRVKSATGLVLTHAPSGIPGSPSDTPTTASMEVNGSSACMATARSG
jgi:hypothetical protein